jgi:tetratricopeptide (TPR) repeat protein
METVTNPGPVRLTLSILLGLSILPATHAQNPPQESTPATGAPAATSAVSPSSSPSLADALHLYRTGKLDAAIEEYKQLASGPEAAMAYAGITRAYLREKDATDAYAAAAKAIELAPLSPDAKVAQGEALFRQGKITDAEKTFVEVINSGAENARAYYGLARVSQTITYFRREKRMIDKAHALDPADPDITRMWMGTLTLNERIKALEEYLAQESDDDVEARTNLERQLTSLRGLPTMPQHQCRMVSKISSTSTNLQLLYDGPTRVRGYGLDVKFNGTTGHLLLDTGAAGILIDQKLAEKAGLQHVVESSIRGIGDKGAMGSYIGHADKIQVGDIEFEDCNVQVIDQSSVINTDGLIGAVEFSHFLVDLDMPNRKMHLSELPPRPDEESPQTELGAGQTSTQTPRFYDRYIAPEMKDYTPIFRINHMLLIPTILNGSVSKLFLIDTGAFSNFVAPAAAREVTHVVDDPHMHVKGISGNVKDVYSANKLTLTFSNLRQENQDMVSVDMKNMSDGAGTEISGSLGFIMLRMLDIKIDYRDALVHFDYNWKRNY